MTKEEYLKFHENFCNKMMAITVAKNHDYAGFEDDDPFANFKIVEKCNIATVEQGFLTRIMDKISRINSFINQGVCNVEDEKIEDTLLDLANYAILMAGYMKEQTSSNITVTDNLHAFGATGHASVIKYEK